MAGPLAGLKVLDLSRILAGPWSTQVLADYGAEVWKVEQPLKGDDTRHWGPPYVKNAKGDDSEQSAYFISANRGKKSITLDISCPEDNKKLQALIAESDILVENYKVGGLKKYHLDYLSVKQIKPDIIYCSITGFGQTGPYAERAGYDAMIQAMGGLMSITGVADNLPGGGPQKVGVAVADLMTGMYAVSAILAALYHRNNTGVGQHIDLALLDTQVAWLANQASNFLVSGDVPSRLGTAHPSIVPYQSIMAKDGYMLLAVGNDRQFQSCCEVLGCSHLAQDERFSRNTSRVKHREILIPMLEEHLAKQKVAFWIKHLSKLNVPCGPINTIDKVFEDEQVQHRQMSFELEHIETGKVPQVANPVKFSETPIEYKNAPPTLGQHNQEFLNKVK